MSAYRSPVELIPPTNATPENAERLGFRFGDKGTHTSRTMMLEDLAALLGATPDSHTRKDYSAAIIDDNVLAKPTLSTRKLSNQRLSELYGLDPTIPLFRILRRLWSADSTSRPQLALLVALARDPLLAGTASAILSMDEGEELQRITTRETLRTAVGSRLNDDILDKVLRNAASSWTQAGHLEGRTFKKRRRVKPTPWTVALALYLGRAVGFRGADLFSTGWVAALDASPTDARTMAQEAKRLGLLDLSMSDDVVELGFERLDPLSVRQS